MDLLKRSPFAFSTEVEIYLFPSVALTRKTHSLPGALSRTTSGGGRSPRFGRRRRALRFTVTQTVPLALFRSYIFVSSVRNPSFSSLMTATHAGTRIQP